MRTLALAAAVLLTACGARTTNELADAGAPDAGVDAGDASDAGTDAGFDAGADAGIDAGVDIDSGIIDAGASRLEVAPAELIFSGVKGRVSAAQLATVANTGSAALTARVTLTGDPDFNVAPTPPLTLFVDAGDTVTLDVRFAPDAGTVGVRTAHLQIGDAGIALHGLATNGEQGNNEPPLQACFDTLGFAVDAGSWSLIIGTGAQPVGDEVLRRLFHRVDASNTVTLRPVARYSPDETLPFGWYQPLPDGGASLHGVGVIALGQDQTLNPALTPDSGSSFDPGAGAFGIYVHSNTFGRDTFTEDPRNTGPTVHAVRVYPVRDRSGTLVPNAYLLAFEDAANGDYQDYVFELLNAGP